MQALFVHLFEGRSSFSHGATNCRIVRVMRMIMLVAFSMLPLMALAQVAMPDFSPNQPVSGVFSPSEGARQFSVQVSCGTQGATIRYTTNGAEPTGSDLSIASGSSVNINRNLTLKAKAWVGGSSSTTRSATYHIGHAVAVGDFHSMATNFDGKLYTWGRNTQGRLGIGNTTNPQPSPQVAVGSMVIDVDGGSDDSATTPRAHSILLKEDGTVWCAGSAVYGRLGTPNTTDQSSFVPVSILDNGNPVNVRAVAAGFAASYALSYDGYVYSWGRNAAANPRLGQGLTTDSDNPTPAKVKISSTVTLDRIVAISAGDNHALALRDDGTVWAWGGNTYGQIGDNGTSTTERAYAVQVHAGATNTANPGLGLAGAISIAAAQDHSLAVLSDGRVVGWGQASYGRIGDGYTSTTSAARRRPVLVEESSTDPEFNGALRVAAGGACSLILTQSGKLYSFGANGQHQLGLGNITGVKGYPTPVLAASGAELASNIVDMAISPQHGIALDETGKIYTWGLDTSGQVGDGTASSTDTNFATNSATHPVLANRAPTITSLTLSSGPYVAPASITLTANGVADLDGNLSSVQFYNAGSAIGSPLTTSPWSATYSNLTAGSYQFSATVSDAVGATASSGTTPTAITVTPPTVTLSAFTPTAVENSATPGKFRFALNKAQLADLYLTYGIHASSTATSGLDYQALSGTLTIPQGSLFADVSVVPMTDLNDEGTETVKLTFLAGPNYLATTTSDTVSITNFSTKIVKPANSGDNQTGAANAFLVDPLVVQVQNFDTNASVPNFNGVTFQVIAGGGKLLPLIGGTEATSQLVVADGGGFAKVRYLQPTAGNVESTIYATIPGRAPLVFKVTTNALIGRWSLDDATGAASAADSSGTGYHGDWRLGSLSTERVEGAGSLQLPTADFSGRGLRVQNTANRLLPDVANKPFTITMWMKTPQIAPGTTIALASNETYLASGFRLAVDTGQAFSTLYRPGDQDQMRICFWTGQSGGTVSLVPRRSISANEWHHVAVSYTGTSGALYVDGELVAEDEGTIVPNANPIYFGQGIGGVRGFEGNLDDIQIFAKALSATEIRERIPQTGVLVDGNSNNIPDLWETKVGLPAEASPDEDGDEVLNDQEYLNQTNPIEAFDLAARYSLDEPANVWDWPNTNAPVFEKTGLGWNGVWKAAGTNAQSLEGSAAYEFSGNTNQGFTIPNTLYKVLPSQGTEPFSLSLWIKPGALAVGAKAAIATNQVVGQSGFRLMTEGVSGTPGLRVLFSTSGLGGTLEMQSDPISANQWHHIVVTYSHNGTTGVGQLYVDGALWSQSEVEGTIVPNAEDIKFAWPISGVAGSYAGLMDDLRFYRKCLPQVGVFWAMGGDDWDGDGISNDWEIGFGQNPLNRADGALDLDGDGLSNFAEFLLFQSPILPPITLAVEKLIPESPATLQLTATPEDPNVSLARVDFYENNTLIGTRNSAPWVLTIEDRAAGSYLYEAKTFTGFGPTFSGSTSQSIVVNNLALSKKSGDALAGPILSENPFPLVVEVRDGAGGPPLEGREVVFTILNGGNGRLLETSGGDLETTISLSTDSAGQAKVWFRQPNALNFVSQIKAVSGPSGHQSEVTFTAKTVSAVLTKSSGDNQFGPIDGILADPLVVEIRDSVTNAPIQNYPVAFSTSGQGKVSASNVYADQVSNLTVLTGADGKAKVRFWSPSLPKYESYIEATAAGSTVTFTATTHLTGNWVTFQVPLGRSSHAFELWEQTDEGATLKTSAGPSMIYNGYVTSSGAWQPYSAPYASVQVERKDNGKFLLKDTTANQFSPWDRYGLANAQWRETDGLPSMRYFAIPASLYGHSLVVQYPNGETFTVTQGMIQGAYDQNNFVSFEYFEAWAPRLNPDTEGWRLIDCTTDMQAPPNLEAPLDLTDWIPFEGALPAYPVSFLVDYNYSLQNISENFTLYIATTTGPQGTSGNSAVDENYHMSFTGSVPQGMTFWLQRWDGKRTPDFIMPAGGATRDVAQYFTPPEHNWSYQFFTIHGTNSTSSYSLVHADGTVTYFENAQTTTVYSWDEYGTQYSYDMLTAYAYVDIAQSWWLQEGSSNLGMGNVFYGNVSLGSNFNAPNGWASYNIPGSRGTNPLRFESGSDLWATSIWGSSGTMGGNFGPNDEWVEWPFQYVGGNYSNWGVTAIRDLLTGESIDPSVTNPEGWFTSQQQSLKMASSRFGHDLRIRVGNGQEFTITQHSIQGVWTMAPNGQSSFASHNYFDATGTRYPDLPWWLLDYSRIGTNGKPELLAATNGEFDYSGAEDTLDSDGDGLADWIERLMGTNPNSADTDGDGIPDSSDPDPLVNTGTGSTSSTLKIFTPLE